MTSFPVMVEGSMVECGKIIGVSVERTGTVGCGVETGVSVSRTGMLVKSAGVASWSKGESLPGNVQLSRRDRETTMTTNVRKRFMLLPCGSSEQVKRF
jgi:hypothetical protein